MTDAQDPKSPQQPQKPESETSKSATPQPTPPATDTGSIAGASGGTASTSSTPSSDYATSATPASPRATAKPVAGTLKLYRDGVQAASGWSVDATTGLVTFTAAPAMGVIVTADFEFDVPVRFDTDQMELTIETYELGSWGQIPVVEIR